MQILVFFPINIEALICSITMLFICFQNCIIFSVDLFSVKYGSMNLNKILSLIRQGLFQK